MKYFKIKNLTNTLKKRYVRSNTALDIIYVDGMIKKTKKIFPDQTIFLELTTLPLSIHKMRVNGLVAVSEISREEFLFEVNKPVEKKVVKKEEKKITNKQSTKEIKTTKKKYTKKNDVGTKKDDSKIDIETDSLEK
ncbi:MAG: hypothetical protein ACOC22_03150 [bacterium]